MGAVRIEVALVLTVPHYRHRGLRTTDPPLHFSPCPYCGYCHLHEAWAAERWHADHDAGAGLHTIELHTEEL